MRQIKDFLVVTALVLLVLGLIIMITCPIRMSDSRAQHALQSAGMHDIKLGGLSFLGCKDDKFRRKFEAVNPNNMHVKGVVCGGWFTSDTIRFD